MRYTRRLQDENGGQRGGLRLRGERYRKLCVASNFGPQPPFFKGNNENMYVIFNGIVFNAIFNWGKNGFAKSPESLAKEMEELTKPLLPIYIKILKSGS